MRQQQRAYCGSRPPLARRGSRWSGWSVLAAPAFLVLMILPAAAQSVSEQPPASAMPPPSVTPVITHEPHMAPASAMPPAAAGPGTPQRPGSLYDEDVEVIRKNMFLPAVAAEAAPPPEPEAAAAPPPIGPPAPEAVPAERPEDFMFITGIVEIAGEKQVLIENRRTRDAYFLREGDPLGEGILTEIATYHILLKEWTTTREIPLGYTVSGKKDTYVAPPATPVMASAPPPPPGPLASASTQGPSRSASTPGPAWPGRESWERMTQEQRNQFLQQRREAYERLRQGLRDGSSAGPTGGPPEGSRESFREGWRRDRSR